MPYPENPATDERPDSDADMQLSERIKAAATRYQAAPDLRATLREQLRAAQVRAEYPVAPAKSRNSRGWWTRIWAIGGGAFAAGAALTFVLLQLGMVPGMGSKDHSLSAANASSEIALQELLDAHVRSMMVEHLTDVVSTDQHTVKPWFNGKLDFSPRVENLAAQGFPLVGGRLEYLGQRQAAGLVYRHNRHIINVFIQAAQSDNSSGAAPPVPQWRASRGFNIAAWQQDAMDYSVISDLNRAELEEFIRELQKQ